MTAPEEFHQFTLKFLDPIQHDYKVIRPIVLFADAPGGSSGQPVEFALSKRGVGHPTGVSAGRAVSRAGLA